MPEMSDEVADYEAGRRGEDPAETDKALQKAIDELEKGAVVEEVKAAHDMAETQVVFMRAVCKALRCLCIYSSGKFAVPNIFSSALRDLEKVEKRLGAYK